MKPVLVNQQGVSETLHLLKEAGNRGKECVVLWFGKITDDHLLVNQVYRPQQTAGADIFRIPPVSIRTIMSKLDSENLMIAAQIHSHPGEAFHSKADDAWAIVRHTHALSLVLPRFALETNLNSFINDTKTYQLNSKNRWIELSSEEVKSWVQIS